MEHRGDFKPAVHVTKLIIQCVDVELSKQNTSSVIELTELKADSLLPCGVWTTQHKFESAKFVQENYLKPAASACRDLWKQRESPETQRWLSTCCLSLLAKNAAI